MKTKLLTLLFFIFSTAVFSQDMIVYYTEMGIRKAEKTGQYPIDIDNGETVRESSVPAKTPLGIIKYFKEQGYEVEVKLGYRAAAGTGVNVWQLFCTKKEE